MNVFIEHLPENDYKGVLDVLVSHFRGGTRDLAWQVAQLMSEEALEKLVAEANDQWTWEKDDEVYLQILDVLETVLRMKREVPKGE